MNNDKYVGMDIHLATVSCAVLDSDGKLLMSTVLQTKAEFIQSFLQSLNGTIHLTFEETTLAHWMFEITQPLVFRVIVCNPRLLGKKEQKNDARDAKDLANLLRLNALKGVYHYQRQTVSEIKQLVVIYNQLTTDRTRIINRLKSVFREQALTVKVESEKIAESLSQLPSEAHRERAKLLMTELESVSGLREMARQQLVKEAEKHQNYWLLQSLPGISSIRAAQLLAWVITPHRFRPKRQFWKYCGLTVITKSSADYQVKSGAIVKRERKAETFGLTKEYHRGLKNLFKSAALDGLRNAKIHRMYQQLIDRGLKESVARVQLARKIAASCLAIWKRGEKFDLERLISQ
jgi:transposase